MPIIKLTVKIIPNCRGSIPYCAAIGINNGQNITIAATVSKNRPTTNRIRLINNKNNKGSVVIDVMMPETAWEICSVVNIQHDKLAVPIIKNTTDEITPVLSNAP